MYTLTDPAGQNYRIEKNTTVGREDCDLEFPAEQGLSRRHAEFRLAGEVLSVVDLGSSNGTRVDGEAITSETVLQPGGRVDLGGFVLVVGREGSADATQLNASPPVQPDPPASMPPPPAAGVAPIPPPPPGQTQPAGVPSAAIAPKSRSAAILLEVIPGLFGILGIGWIYAGRVNVGVPVLIGGLLFAFLLAVVVILTMGCGVVLAFPIWLVAMGLSAFLLNQEMNRTPGQFV